MRLMRVEIKTGLAVKLFRIPSTAGSKGSYYVAMYRKGPTNKWTETVNFPSISKLKHAEIFFNWALTRVEHA